MMQTHQRNRFPLFPTSLLLFLACALTGCLASAPADQAVELDVMSFNIRNGRANDGDNAWEHRRELVCAVLRDNAPDIVGIQEAFDFQLDALEGCLPQYRAIGEGRDGARSGEHSSILILEERFDVEDSGTFWLSDTPDVVSRSWGNGYHRVCTWVRLADLQTGVVFYVFNTHLDHRSQPSRLNSARLIAQRVAEVEQGIPVILTGDFNAGEGNPVIDYLKGGDAQVAPPVALVDTFRVMHPDQEQVGTGNGGYSGRRNGAKIDYIFVTPGVQTLGAGIDQEPRGGRYPSDHYPVTARVCLGG
ncbi:MAG TPA: endonuclease/exonuclease/phosphatase family protein [Planctomycetota bacterium]|nr:endonuclease/exonuclease/phosphatase family protein [Planctomycetota bacterium]